MLALTREIALPGLALLSAAALLLASCGGSSASKSQNATSASERQKAEGKVHGVPMFLPPAPPPGEEQAVVLRVGSEPITRATYVHWTKALTPEIASYEPKSRTDCSSTRARGEVRGISQQQLRKLSSAQAQALCVHQKQAQVRESALMNLISSRWVIGEASERGVEVSEAQARQQVAKDVAQQFKSKAEFQRSMTHEKRTLADITMEIRAQLSAERLQALIQKKASKKINEASIARYYRTHKATFEVPETRDIRAVRTWTRSAIEGAIAEVRHGKSIAEVAKRVSIDKPSNEHGGLVQGIARGQQEPGLDQAIFAARPHELTGPLHLRKRYYVFEVVKITPASIKPFKEIEAKVRETLSQKLLEEERARFIAAFRKKWLARTSCSPGYVISRCKQWRGARPFAREAFELR